MQKEKNLDVREFREPVRKQCLAMVFTVVADCDSLRHTITGLSHGAAGYNESFNTSGLATVCHKERADG